MDVGGLEDAVIIRIVLPSKKPGKTMYQVEYHVPDDPPGKRHQQPWYESSIRAKALKTRKAAVAA